ncbi:MAG: 4-(cytidine 5'-diphospho)-2-C-methyl-D-erythritol kinase [Saccharospirillum sp.]
MTTGLTLPCPAKLNRMLHIVGRRADGYHNLQTLFQLVDFGDWLTLEPTPQPELSLTCSHAALATDDNLVLKAARLLKDATGIKAGARLHLEKRLPMGGGLGGGSSDAATTLLGLNRLWGLQLSQQALLDMALLLGADVPLFVAGHSAWAEGIGEVLTPVSLDPAWYVVITPNIHINTAELFGHHELTRNTPVSTIRSALAGQGHNDFEPLAKRLYPELNNAFSELAHYGPFRLSGSGASLFTQTQSDMTAQQTLQQILARHPGFTGFVARGVNQSPLQRALAEQA